MCPLAKTDGCDPAAFGDAEATKTWNAENESVCGQVGLPRIGIHFSEEVLEWKPETPIFPGTSDCNLARVRAWPVGGQIHSPAEGKGNAKMSDKTPGRVAASPHQEF